MAMKLTVQNAEIKTATVEIQTLTISGKQVTLAVFRQLREEELIAEDGTFNGVPWGTVNYHPDKCADANEHQHVVWQRGTELLRARVDKYPAFFVQQYGRMIQEDYSPDSGHSFYSALVETFLLGEPVTYMQGDPIKLGRTQPTVRDSPVEPQQSRRMKVRGICSDLYMDYGVFETVKLRADLAVARNSAAKEATDHPAESGDGWKTRARRRLPVIEGEVAEALAKLAAERPEYTLDDLWQAYDADMEQEAERRQRHVDARQAIADLPQLFIAV